MINFNKIKKGDRCLDVQGYERKVYSVLEKGCLFCITDTEGTAASIYTKEEIIKHKFTFPNQKPIPPDQTVVKVNDGGKVSDGGDFRVLVSAGWIDSEGWLVCYDDGYFSGDSEPWENWEAM